MQMKQNPLEIKITFVMNLQICDGKDLKKERQKGQNKTHLKI